jgi:NAD-dependent deacetylase sirtuin 2
MAESQKAGDEPSGSSPQDGNESGFLTNLLSKLHIKGSSEPAMKILEEPSLEGVKRYIESGKCKNIIVMAGAGISTSAGIPDFRSPGSGLYDNVTKKYKLEDPQAIFEIGFFRNNPKPFFVLCKELFPESFEPTVSHHFVKLLHDKGLLLRHYTQNIDGLERKAGLPDEKIVEAHGTMYTSHCINSSCNKEYPFEWIKAKIFADEVPICEDCETTIKPDIVFFGENLPWKFFECVEEDFDKCDLLIIMGTSLVVQPFASLVERVSSKCPRLLINREKVGQRNSSIIQALIQKYAAQDDGFDISSLLSGKGLNFESKQNRDVALLGDCDDGCKKLAEALGWADDLKKLGDPPKGRKEWL